MDELQVDTNENISFDHSKSLEHCCSDSQDIQADSDHDVGDNKNLEENHDTDSHFAATEDEVRSVVAELRANDKSKSDIEASAHVMRNPYKTIKKNVDTINQATLVGLKIRINEKDDLVRMNPCQPPESILSKRRGQQGDRSRFCSQQVFFHEDKSRRRWLFYLPCLLFTDAVSRGESARQKQGNAFTCSGFRNWKKQHNSVLKHEQSDAHLNAKIAEALFLQQGTIAASFQRQETLASERRKQQVISNRNVMNRIVDAVILLGRHGLPFRGHRESLASPYQNTGKFLELLKFLSQNDSTIKE